MDEYEVPFLSPSPSPSHSLSLSQSHFFNIYNNNRRHQYRYHHIQAAKQRNASRIFAIDINPKKFDIAKELGATDCIDPKTLPQGMNIQSHIVNETKWGVDYSFESTGNVDVMRSALECAHRGWGQSCIIGVAPAGAEISTRPFQLVTGIYIYIYIYMCVCVCIFLPPLQLF